MGKIHILSDDLRNKIAAGEVIERPASIVKELMENSIDAGATQIEVIIVGGGNVSIQVIDNGHGLDGEDLILAFSRYSTSKITSKEDLHGIHTLGFRGEALASIASVAQVRAISTTDGREEGNELIITDGNFSDLVPASIQEGTSVTVTDLFFSVPARRKFLKSAQVEFRHILQTIRRYSLSYPELAFRLISDNNELLNLQPEKMEDRIGNIFDPSYRNNVLPVTYEKKPFTVQGFVGNLNLVRKRRGEQFFFLNRRYIVNSLMNSAIYSAYQSLINRGEFPLFVVNLNMPLDQVDVNVHPVKIEVRFRDEWRVYHVLKSAVTEAITDILKTIPDFSSQVKREGPFESYHQSKFPKNNTTTHPRSTVQPGSLERAKEYVKSISTRTPDQEFLDLETIWQVHNKYIVSEIKSGLVIIDQHVAHERVLFDQAMESMEGSSMPSQSLLFPNVVEFPTDDYGILIDLLPYLTKIGFRLKEFGKNSILIEGVPSEMGWGSEKNILKEIIDDYQTHRKEYSSFQEGFAASYACRAAIKAGDQLTKEEMQTLVDRLFATKHPYYCPHGRPIIINLSIDELDRRFERS